MFDINKSKTDNSVNSYPTAFTDELYAKYNISFNQNNYEKIAVNSIQTALSIPNFNQVELNTISFPNIEIINSILRTLNPEQNLEYIKKKTEFTEEVQKYILNNKLMLEVLVKIISKTIDIISKVYHDKFKIKIDLNYDYEILDLEELIVTIYIMEQNFDNLIQEWEKIGESTKKIFALLKLGLSKEEKLLYTNIDSKLIISVQEWEYESI